RPTPRRCDRSRWPSRGRAGVRSRALLDEHRVLGAVGFRLAGARLLPGRHGPVADLPTVAELVGLYEGGRQRIAAPVALAPVAVDADPHCRDVTDPSDCSSAWGLWSGHEG